MQEHQISHDFSAASPQITTQVNSADVLPFPGIMDTFAYYDRAQRTYYPLYTLAGTAARRVEVPTGTSPSTGSGGGADSGGEFAPSEASIELRRTATRIWGALAPKAGSGE